MSDLNSCRLEDYIKDSNIKSESVPLQNDKVIEEPYSKNTKQTPDEHNIDGVLRTLLDAVSKINLIDEKDLPIQIAYSDGCGRFLKASRDINQGETIFREQPIVMTPKGGSGPVCLDCFKLLPDTNWSICDKCKAPKCEHNCSGSSHTSEECKILGKVFAQNVDKQNDIGWIKLINVILTPLRIHLLVKNCDKIKFIIDALQSSIEFRKETLISKFIDTKIIPFFEKEIIDLEISSHFIHHVCGVFDTNAFEITSTKDCTSRVLLSLSSLINHSCIPNTGHWTSDGYCMVCASVNIKKGEIITKSYTQGLWGTSTRLAHLNLTKHFICTCLRCKDPTECGSHISSIKCDQCSDGLLVPPTASQSPWKCNICSETLSPSSVKSILSVTSGVVAMANNMDNEDIFKAVKRLTKMLGLNHSSSIDLQYMFVKFVSQNVLTVSTTSLQDALKTLSVLMNVANKLRPGMTKLRGLLFYHKMKISNEFLKRRINCKMEESVISDDDCNSHHLLELKSEGEECENILKWDLLLEEVQLLRQELSNYPARLFMII